MIAAKLKELVLKFRNSPPEVFLGKGVLNICSKFTGAMPKCDFNKVAKQVFFRTPFPINTSGGLLLKTCFFFRLLKSSLETVTEESDFAGSVLLGHPASTKINLSRLLGVPLKALKVFNPNCLGFSAFMVF